MREEILERDQFGRIVRFDVILSTDQLFELNANPLTAMEVQEVLMFDAASRLLNNPSLDGVSFSPMVVGNRLTVRIYHRSAPAGSSIEIRPFQFERVSKAMDVAIFAEDPSPARVRIVSGLTGDLVGRILKHPQVR